MSALKQMSCDFPSHVPALVKSARLMPLNRALHEMRDYKPGEWLELEVPRGLSPERFQHVVLVYAKRRDIAVRTLTEGSKILIQRRAGHPRRPAFTPLQLAEIVKMRREGRHPREVAELFNTTQKYVQKLALAAQRKERM